MRSSFNSIAWLLFLIVFVSGCKRTYKNDAPATSENQQKEQIINTNRMMVHEEAGQIDDFIKRHNWQMQTSGTGLRYDIYQKASGPSPTASSIVSIAFKLYLLDGTLCYNAEDSKPLKFQLGTGVMINGLEEGLMMMNAGSRARFVIPDHLAYGMTGDGNKVPPAAALFYDVHLIGVDK